MLEIEELTKVYLPPPAWLRPLVRAAAKQPVHALRGVSLGVAPGEVLGLVGPNGAGKTTLVRIVAALLLATSGQVRIDGIDVARRPHETARRLGLALEGDRGLYDRMTGRQNLEFFGTMAGLRPAVARRRAGELLERMGLADRDKLVFGYSSGMRMRLTIARALLADPPLVVLDEPTRSLDPVASRFVCRLVRDLAGEGRAVLLSNHRLDEVVAVSTHVVAIVGGEVRFRGAPAALGGDEAQAASALGDLLAREATA